jgi:hypothetical protein
MSDKENERRKGGYADEQGNDPWRAAARRRFQLRLRAPFCLVPLISWIAP